VLTLRAHAKINLGLSVLGRRADGFHEVDTLLVRLALHDTLTLEPASTGVRLVVIGTDLDIPPEQNLAYRAAELYLAEIGEGRGVAIELTKRIPAAAGLGGGSSDAGAVLRGLAQLYPAEVDSPRLAAQLGSDVPFFAADLSAARATGRGEVLTPAAVPELQLVLVNPGIAVSAKDAYMNLQNVTPPLELPELPASVAVGEAAYFNALEPGVVGLEPAVGEVLDALRAAALSGVRMSGSGSTCFGLAQSQRGAQLAAATLTEAYPEWWVWATHTF
jgi:4-diphosphocytidyl-2-C-methyl-D-erythritol kinase